MWMTTAQAKSVGGLAEPAGEVVVQVLLIVADPGDVAVGSDQHGVWVGYMNHPRFCAASIWGWPSGLRAA